MFEFRLGLALHKTRAEIRAMPYKEFREWQIYSQIEPFGYDNDEYRLATILAMLYNINRGKGKTKEPKDFMRDFENTISKRIEEKQRVENMTREELLAQVKKDFGALK